MSSSVSPARLINVLGVGIVLSLLGDNTLYTVLPDPTIAARAGLTLAWVGVLLGVNRIVRIVFNAGAGLLYDRMPRRGLLIGSLALGAICNVIYAVASGPELFLLGRVLWGAAWSGLWIGGNTLILDISDETTRGRYSGRFQMWFFVGVAIGTLAGGVFTDLFGFRGGLWVSAALTGAAAGLWFVLLPETGRPKQVHAAKKRFGRNLIVKALPAGIPMFAVRFAFAGVIAATTILWLEQFVGRGLQLAGSFVPLATLTGAFSAARVVLSIVSAPLAGISSDRIGNRWSMLAAALVVGAAGMWLMGSDHTALAIGGALMAAVTAGSAQALVPAIVGDRADQDQHARALGIAYTLGDFGSALGPPMALGLLTQIGLLGIYRLSAAVLLLAGLFSIRELVRENRARTSASDGLSSGRVH